MKRTIERITRAAMLAVAFMLCASSAWAAVKPVAVWNSDFADSATRGGFTLNTNGNSLESGVITIKSISGGATGGVLFTSTKNYNTQHFSAIVGLEGLDGVSLPSGGAAIVTAGSVDSTRKLNQAGIGMTNARLFRGIWNNSFWDANPTTAMTNSTYSVSETRDYFIYYCNHLASSGEPTAGGGGTALFLNKDTTKRYFAGGLRGSGVNYTRYSIGGFNGGSTDYQLAGAKVKYVALLPVASSAKDSDLRDWALTDMTKSAATFTGSDANTGVNIPVSGETISQAFTPAAVFVQNSGTTFTIEDGGSITVGDGTGPFYVSDDASLTIDASGITTLSTSNPYVMLVTGTIYGTKSSDGSSLISVTCPTPADGYMVSPVVTDRGIAIALQKSVSITSPFDGTTLAAPTAATVYSATKTEVSFGNDLGFYQTVGAGTAVAALVEGGTYTKVNGFLKQSEAPSYTGSIAKYLVMSGGTADYVKGVQEAHYSLSNANQIQTTGDAILQLNGNASVKFAFGAGDKGGFTGSSGSKSSEAKVTGSTGVTVMENAIVNGSIVGGWGSAHGANATVTGNTAVMIKNVQSSTTANLIYDKLPAGWIIGGSAYQANEAGSMTTVSGNSSVVVSLESSASGTFVKNIVGGSFLPDDVAGDAEWQKEQVGGNSSVTITAPSAVTFSGNIVGGGYSGRGSGGGVGRATVGGSSSVTLTGGTYSGTIVAGGYAPNNGNASVGTTATLTLNAGTVISNGAILDGGKATGLRTLAVNGDFDFSNVTVRNFDVIQVAANKTLTLQAGHEEDAAITLGDGAKLRIVVASQDIYRYDGHLSYCTITKGEGATLEYGFKNGYGEYVKIGEADAINGVSLIPYFQTFKVSNGTVGGSINTASNWGGNAVPTGRNAAFYVNNAEGITITVDTDITFGDIQVLGSGIVTFTGTGGHKLSCSNLDIASGVTVKIGGTSDSEALNVSNGTITGGGSLQILNGAKMVLNGVTCARQIICTGTLQTAGATTLSSKDNQLNDYGHLNVMDGKTIMSFQQQYIGGGSNYAYITIDSGAELEFSSEDPIYYNGYAVVKVKGTLTLESGKSIKLGSNTPIYIYPGGEIGGDGTINVGGNGSRPDSTIKMYSSGGDSSKTASISCPIYLNTNSGTANIIVEDGVTLACSGAISGAEGKAITKQGAGTLKLQDIDFSKPILGSEGTVEFYVNSDHRYATAVGSTFSGKFVVTQGNDKWPHFQGTPPFFNESAPPDMDVTGGFVLTGDYNNNYLSVRNLSGSGSINTNYGEPPKENNVYVDTSRTIKTLQTDNTTFSGLFATSISKDKNRNSALTVYGANTTTKYLELRGANSTYGPLTIDAYGKVIFSGSGSWNNGATTVKENGVIESQRNAQVAGAVTLESGATVSIVKVGGSLVPFTAATVNLPAEGTVYVDLTNSGITSASGATAIIKGTVNDADYLENLSVVGYDGEGAFSYDDVNNQIVYTPVAMDEWSYGSATWSSSSVTDGDTHTITYHEGISDVAFGAIASSPATITLNGKRTPASVTFNGGAGTTYVITGGSFEPVGTVTIISGTVKIDTDATLSGVTGSGTLEVAAGRTVTLTSNTALDGIASLTGSGTLVLPVGTAPSTSGLATLLGNANWRGTVVVSEYNGGTSTALPIGTWGNSGSKVKLVGVSGKISGNYATGTGEVILENGTGDYDYGLKLTAAPSGMVQIKKLSGPGTFKEATGAAWQTVIAFHDASDFTGNIEQTTEGGRICVATAGTGYPSGQGFIYVWSGYSVKLGDGNHWYAGDGKYRGGIQIEGTVEMLGGSTMTAGGTEGVTLCGGATIKFDDIGTAVAPKYLTIGGSSPFTFSSGTVTVDFGEGAVFRDGATLIDWSGASLANPPAGTFKFSGGVDNVVVSGTRYVLSSETSGLYLREAVAQATTSGSAVTYHATVAAAISAAGSGGSVVILKSTDENITYDKTQVTLSRLNTDVTTGTVDPGTEYTATAGSTPDSGVYPYTITNKATTYYWTDADGADHNWSTVGNWAVGSSSGSVATRSPTSIDGVVFGDGASVTIAGASCASMSVAGEVEISGTGDLNIYGNVTDGGSGVLTLSGVCLNNWANESSTGVAITIAPAVSFVSGAGIASHNRGSVTINGATSIGGLFKLWDIATVSFSGGLSVDSGATLQLNQNLDLSRVTTVFNGNFSKTANSSENTTLTLGAVIVSASTTPTVSAGTIVLSGAVSVSGGATFTIPASGVTISGATFNLTAVNAVLVAPESLSVTVSTSLGGKLVKHVTDAGNTTYSVADSVATFGGTPYGSIANAIEAAVAASGGTVTLAADSSEDITLPNGVSFCDGGHSYTGTITTDTANHIYYNTTTVAEVTTYTPLSAEASVTASAVTTYYETFDAARAVAGANTITLLTDITINVAENATLTISSPIAGSFGITKTGAGTLVLTGMNAYSGATAVNAGVLDVAVSTGNGVYTVAASGRLKVSGVGFQTSALTINGTFEVAAPVGTYFLTATTLTLSDGAEIIYTTKNKAITVSTLNLPESGTVTIDCSALSLSATTSLIVGSVNAAAMSKLNCSAPNGYVVGVVGSDLKAFVPQAKIGGTYYASLTDAIAAASDVGNTVIELTSDFSTLVNVGGKDITFAENGGTFTGRFVGTGTVTLSELLNRALCQNAPDGWEGLMVLPVIENAQDLNLNNYGAEKDDGKWTTVNVTGVNGGYIANATVNPVVELVGNMRLTSCSQNFANTFEVVKGSGDFDLSTATFSDSYVYFLLKDVSGFTGSVKTKTGGVGIVLGGATKPTGTDDLGKIIVNTAATIGAGETWVAPGGVRVSEGIVVTMGADASISGTVTLKLGASVKVPSGTAAPTITTDVPYYTVTSTTAAGVTTYMTVKKPGTIFSVW